MVDCKPYATPLSVKLPITSTDSLPCTQPSVYRNIVGALQYLTIIRPKLSYVVNQACQFMHSPIVGNFTSVKWILCYVKVSQPSPPILWRDDLSSISLATNHVFHRRSKHIEVDWYFIKENVVVHQHIIKYVPTQDQLADIFTKALSTA
ncbi:uncharacterized protein LOC114285721 [Camellia sinensis]|uniref:uncharacterized protein LOC114285721 n=1 Tax=Camellia sinensis TaxID=4442 RepID=UPI001035F50C|nr:uncharacterized protein LOC114285721 [Camellia sinensis]